jgi:GT2 family glycosyltransferase
LAICSQFSTQRSGIEIVEETLEGGLASAGEARRRAFQCASQTERESLILTTDADAVPEHSWIEKNILEMQAGADVVCGTVQISPQDALRIPSALHDDQERESYLLSTLDEISYLLNPDPFDPWPRHQQRSGASIAVRSKVLESVGGAPAVAAGEDRLLIERLRLVDARIRHAADIAVQVSGRLEGRAAGGMAETIKRRISCQDY